MNRRSFFASIFGAAGFMAVNPFKFLGSLAKAKPVAEPIAGTMGYNVYIKKIMVFDGSTWTRLKSPEIQIGSVAVGDSSLEERDRIAIGDWKC